MREFYPALKKSEIDEIQPQIDAAYQRHIDSLRNRETISLDPYSMVPIEDYEKLKNEYRLHVDKWAESNIDIDQMIKAIYKVDAATEENLPWYTADLLIGFESWIEWIGRWTAEERSHGEIMVRDMEARGFLDMSKEWLPIREHNLAAGIHVKIESPADGLAYLPVQELLTREAHFYSSRLMDNSARKTLRDIGSDEGRHYQFYVSALGAFALVNPDAALTAMRRQHEADNFSMPGKQGIKRFSRLASTIAAGGVFDSITVLKAQKQTIDESGMLLTTPVTDEGKAALEWAQGISEKSDRVWEDNQLKLDEFRSKQAKKIEPGLLRPLILGHTVEIIGKQFVPK